MKGFALSLPPRGNSKLTRLWLWMSGGTDSKRRVRAGRVRERGKGPKSLAGAAIAGRLRSLARTAIASLCLTTLSEFTRPGFTGCWGLGWARGKGPGMWKVLGVGSVIGFSLLELRF